MGRSEEDCILRGKGGRKKGKRDEMEREGKKGGKRERESGRGREEGREHENTYKPKKHINFLLLACIMDCIQVIKK